MDNRQQAGSSSVTVPGHWQVLSEPEPGGQCSGPGTVPVFTAQQQTNWPAMASPSSCQLHRLSESVARVPPAWGTCRDWVRDSDLSGHDSDFKSSFVVNQSLMCVDQAQTGTNSESTIYTVPLWCLSCSGSTGTKANHRSFTSACMHWQPWPESTGNRDVQPVWAACCQWACRSADRAVHSVQEHTGRHQSSIGQLMCSLLLVSLKSSWRSNCSESVGPGECPWGWPLWLSLNLKFSKVSFIDDKQAQQNLTPVTSLMCLLVSSVEEALHILPALLCAAPDFFLRSSAAQSPQSSSCTAGLRLAVSWLQRRVMITLDEWKLFSHWNRF